jgi:cyclopropane fatty-acyl-phospholipid synthase-like methyltransferase
MTTDVKRLYTERVNAYLRFNAAFLYPQALQAFFESSDLLRPNLRILDAGCGTGIATIALLHALQKRSLPVHAVHGFDLTPAMLARFQQMLASEKILDVELKEADVRELDALPASWTGYDLIVSASMLEYLPQADAIPALCALHGRLVARGCLLVIITRKNWMNKLLIEKWWQANGYTCGQLKEFLTAAGFERTDFRKFHYRYFWQNFWGHIVEASPS